MLIENKTSVSLQNQTIDTFPIKPIKRILKEHYNGEISTYTCTFVKEKIIELLHILAEEAVKEFENYNSQRKKHGLPQLKRLDLYAFKETWDRIYKNLGVSKRGEVGKHNEILFRQDGVKNDKKT
jgi:hypothetical protein